MRKINADPESEVGAGMGSNTCKQNLPKAASAMERRGTAIRGKQVQRIGVKNDLGMLQEQQGRRRQSFMRGE